MVYMVLSSVNESLGISISFDADHNAIINYTGTQSFTAVRQQYVTLLVTEILTNAVFINLLNKKNNNIIARPLGPNTSGNVFSVFDTEIKTSAMSIEKILQSATNLDYEEEYYSFNMKDRISKIAKEILVYYLVIVHDNHQFVFAADVVDQIPFVLYDISRGGK